MGKSCKICRRRYRCPHGMSIWQEPCELFMYPKGVKPENKFDNLKQKEI